MTRLVGGDPEVFAEDVSGLCIPPVLLRDNGLQTFGFADKDAKNPRHPMFYKDELVTIHEDGAAFEFTLKPSTNPLDYYNIYEHGLDVLGNLLKPYNLSVFTKPAIKFDSQILAVNGVIDVYRLFCVRFGCDKDINVYTGDESKDFDATQVNYRFGGGHIHISPIEHKHSGVFTRLADILMGNTFIFNTPFPEEEKMRQNYYGVPGKIREQFYPGGITGIEYRVPSNSWLKDLDTVKMMFKAIDLTLDIFANPPKAFDLIDKYLDSSINNIMTFDQKGSQLILQEVGII